MLTRIEIDGFKTFRTFSLDIPPFLVVLGRNASGKSNLFDAINFLKSTADRSLAEAVSRIRGEPPELLHAATNGQRSSIMAFAVEVLLDDEASDDFGDVARVRHARLRYELSLELRPARRGGAVEHATDRPERLFVRNEAVRLIRQKADPWVQRYGGSPQERRNFARYSSRSEEFLLETEEVDGRRMFTIHQDGNAGRRRNLPAAEAVSTVLSSLSTANEFPHLFALKKELESWGLLHLDPAALRGVNSFDDDEFLASNGANLANTLKRITLQTAEPDRPEGVLSDVEADLAAVVPEVVGLEVADDRARRQRQVLVRTRDDAPYSAGVGSDGTLRAGPARRSLRPGEQGVDLLRGAGERDLPAAPRGLHRSSAVARVQLGGETPTRSGGPAAATAAQQPLPGHPPRDAHRRDRCGAARRHRVLRLGDAGGRRRQESGEPGTQGAGRRTDRVVVRGRGPIGRPRGSRVVRDLAALGSRVKWIGPAFVSEGPTDDRFLARIVGRAIEDACAARFDDLVLVGDVITIRARGGPASISDSVHSLVRNSGSYNLVVFHHDMGANPGRVEREWVAPMRAAWDRDGTGEPLVFLLPVRESEAWALVDGDALRSTFGVNWDDVTLGLPDRPRRVADVPYPKTVMRQISSRVSGRPVDYHSRLGELVDLRKLGEVDACSSWIEELCGVLENDLHLNRIG